MARESGVVCNRLFIAKQRPTDSSVGLLLQSYFVDSSVAIIVVGTKPTFFFAPHFSFFFRCFYFTINSSDTIASEISSKTFILCKKRTHNCSTTEGKNDR